MAVARRLVVMGLGLIGGSVAAGARASGAFEAVLGWDQDPEAVRRGHALGYLDAPAWDGVVDARDLVLVAVPTLAAPAVIGQLWDAQQGVLARGAVVTDAASVKGSVIQALQQHCGGTLPPGFVPGHPIAGSERSGVDAARADLFQAHRVILTPTATTDVAAIERVTSLWQAVGARVDRMDAARHDALLAMTSHLPHLLAFTLVDTLGRQPDPEAILALAAGGFRDFTRIASSDPLMWSDIFSANRVAVEAVLDAFEERLAAVRDMLGRDDRQGLQQLFADARALRESHLTGGNP